MIIFWSNFHPHIQCVAEQAKSEKMQVSIIFPQTVDIERMEVKRIIYMLERFSLQG